ncbi:MAG TPA: hypothetical protein VM575_01195, partial [Nocardioides sp.]|nr:hypothetical protein [Nocardioides sp.]
PYWFAVGLVVLTLAPRFWATATGYDGDVFHSSLFVAWLFAGGWAAAVARGIPQRTVAAGLLLLVWVPTVPWPRAAIGVVGQIASASLSIYLTHWQVYPHLENRWPLGGLLASLAIGVLAWRIGERIPSWTRLIERPRPHHYAPNHTIRQEAR